MRDALNSRMHREQHSLPSANKCTNPGATIDHLLLGTWVHEVYITLFLRAFGNLSFKDNVTDGNLDPELQRELTFPQWLASGLPIRGNS